MDYKIGDKVIVARKPSPMPEGWGDRWYRIMDELVGQTGVVVKAPRCGNSGYCVRMDDDSLFQDEWVTLPAEALELCPPELPARQLYSVYHADPPNFLGRDPGTVRFVGMVEAATLAEVFGRTQNLDDDPWKEGERSTSVGDLISGPEGTFMVDAVGFRSMA